MKALIVALIFAVQTYTWDPLLARDVLKQMPVVYDKRASTPFGGSGLLEDVMHWIIVEFCSGRYKKMKNCVHHSPLSFHLTSRKE